MRQQRVGHRLAVHWIADHYRHDVAWVFHHRQPNLAHQLFHRPNPLFQPRPFDLAYFQMSNRGESTGGDCGRERCGKNEARRIRAEGVAAGSARSNIATHHAEALGEGAVDDVDAMHYAVALGDAAATRTVKANRMYLIEISQRAILLGKVADRSDRSDMAVHRVDALEHDDLRRLACDFLEMLLEMLDVVVAEDVLLAAAPPNALNH